MYGRSWWRASSTERQICSPVGCSSSRSSCRWSRCSSPERRAPPSNGKRRSRLRRSRSRNSASLATVEEPEQPTDVGAQLCPVHDRVEVPEAVVRLGEAEVVRQLLARRLLDDAGAGEGEQGAGL